MPSQYTQGPWTRIRPLQIDEVDDYTAAAYKQAELTWGHFPNNLAKVMGYCPRLIQTEVEYCNTFIFDPQTFQGDRQVAGFNDRFLKELVISRTSLANRSLYSITHHAFIGMKLYSDAGRRDEAHQKYLYLHEHEKHPAVYTERERVVLDYTVKVTQDAHLVTDEDFRKLRHVLREHNLREPGLAPLSDAAMARHVEAQIVELTWLIGHFCLLNRWFTALQVPDEGPQDEANFAAAYVEMVPEDMRQRNAAILAGQATRQPARLHPTLVARAMGRDAALSPGLVFRPEPPGDQGRLTLPVVTLCVDAEEAELETHYAGLAAGALSADDVCAVLDEMQATYGETCPAALRTALLGRCQPAATTDPFGDIELSHHLERMALVAVRLVDRAQKSLLKVEPLSEVHFAFTPRSKVALRLGWEAMAKQGRFPLPPKGRQRLDALRRLPAGVMHFVSASDSDAGYYYTMGIALSPEAQALGSMDIGYGLDGELIVPGQAVSPIPPMLAMATRLFAASIPTSSNISEEVQSIPYSSFAHAEIMDIAPMRGYLIRPPTQRAGQDRLTHVQEAMRQQLDQYKAFLARTTPAEREHLPDVGAAIDVSDLPDAEIVQFARSVLHRVNDWERSVTALFLLLGTPPETAADQHTRPQDTWRVQRTCRVIDATQALGLKYVAVCDAAEDTWLPNLLEYFTWQDLNALADYADARGVILCDGRPIDPVYTAATSAQRIQSVYTTLSVDILKMGMWLSLDALTARCVWRELQRNPHIPERMCLMPIGIVEPFSGFVDNRDRHRTPRAIIDPFAKIQFMIAEAAALGMPALLTDTRHKERWVLLGSVDGDCEPHVREKLGAVSLIGREKFLACERLARRAGVLLGQAGSIETDQLFWIISDTTFDAAQERCNPATAVWTAETERVLRRPDGSSLHGDLQAQRSAAILPYLATVNRAYEAHAKLDGWLRYLEHQGQGNEPLRRVLLHHKHQVEALQARYLDAQGALAATPAQDAPAAREKYQTAWDAFRKAFCDYHADITRHFVPVRHQVATLWATA